MVARVPRVSSRLATRGLSFKTIERPRRVAVYHGVGHVTLPSRKMNALLATIRKSGTPAYGSYLGYMAATQRAAYAGSVNGPPRRVP